jgi:hypothetical protein
LERVPVALYNVYFGKDNTELYKIFFDQIGGAWLLDHYGTVHRQDGTSWVQEPGVSGVEAIVFDSTGKMHTIESYG